MSNPARLLPAVLLLNAALMVAIAWRYVTVRDAWRVHHMAATRAAQLLPGSE